MKNYKHLNIKAFQAILGHKDIAVTMKYYVDVDSEFEKSENANVENYLKARDIFGVEFNSDGENN